MPEKGKQDTTSSVSQKILSRFANMDNRKSGDYIGKDGFLYCGKCHTRKQADIDLKSFGGVKRVPILCSCGVKDKKAAEMKLEQSQRIQKLREDGITDTGYLECTFANDDRHSPSKSAVCRKYVAEWPKMRKQNIGILLYGDVGTGKSFLACAISNALIEKGVHVCVTNFPRLLNQLSGFADGKQRLLDRLQGFDLLVLDDFSAERDTSYATEQVFNVIDARSRAGKPLIITTNLTLQELQHPQNKAYKRIYDRVLSMCPITLKMDGQSRRAAQVSQRQETARKILKGES